MEFVVFPVSLYCNQNNYSMLLFVIIILSSALGGSMIYSYIKIEKSEKYSHYKNLKNPYIQKLKEKYYEVR